MKEVRINTVSENISEEDNLESCSSISIKYTNDDEYRIVAKETSDFGLDLVKPTYVISEIINEDGTSLDDFPENPLKEKWLEKYPPTRYGSKCAPFETLPDGTVVANYGCILCHEKCMHSSSWEVPEEDKEEWDKYQEQVKEYHRIHNPNLIANINKTFEILKKQKYLEEPKEYREQEQLKKEKPKLIESWEELVGLENDKYYLDIDVKMCCGHIRFKEKPEEDTYEPYLSTHSFYSKSYQDYTLILQEYGFNVQLKNCDGETVYVELNEQWKHHGICKFCRRDKFCSKACKPAMERVEQDMQMAIHYS